MIIYKDGFFTITVKNFTVSQCKISQGFYFDT